MFCDGTELFDS